MTTNTPAKTAAKKSTPAKKTAAPATPAPKPVATSYRDAAEFDPALKAALSLSKGNPALIDPLRLVRHLAWKTPGGTVGWSKGTTTSVVDYADDIACPVGTPIPEAMSAALAAAEKAVADEPQRKAVAVLTKVIQAHA